MRTELNAVEIAPLHARCRCTIVAYLDGVGKGERVAGRERLPEDVTYKQWRATFGERRAADENTPLRQRGRAIIDKLAAGQLPTAASGAKVATDGFKFDLQRFGRYEEQVLKRVGKR